MNKLLPLIAFSVLLLAPVLIHDAFALIMIDFEGLGLSEGDPVVMIPGVPGVTFSDANLVVPGPPTTAFSGNSQPGGNSAGGADNASTGNSIRPSTPSGTVTITFDGPVKDLTYDLLDVEVGSFTEIVTSRVYDATVVGNLLQTIVTTGVNPGTGDGDGEATTVDFAGTENIRRLEFELTSVSPPGAVVPGYAADNVFFNLVEDTVGDLTIDTNTNKIGLGLHIFPLLGIVEPTKGVTIHIEISDPSKALLSTIHKNAPLTSSIDINLQKGSQTAFEIHGIEEGPVDIVATAPGFNSLTKSFTLVPPELEIRSLGGQQAAQGQEDLFQIFVGINDSMFIPQSVTKLASPLLVSVSTDDQDVGKVRDPDAKKGSPTSPISKEIPPGQVSIDMFFVPQNPGQVIVFAQIPSNVVDVTVDVVPGPAFQLLIDEINDQDLTQNQKDNLNRWVQRSNERWTDGNIDFAIKAMGQFEKTINTLDRTNKISSSDAEKLINIAKAIIFDIT